jgi:hypothetical protein
VYDDPAARPQTPARSLDGLSVDDHASAITHPTTADEVHSAHPWVCPFLRAVDERERLVLPLEAPDPANRCAALREPVPQSLRQQELVCLTRGHVNCPRYLRGSLGTREPPVREPQHRTVTPAIAGALTVFAAAFLVSLAFVVSNGGLELTAAASTPAPSGGVLAAVETPPPTAAPTPQPTPQATPSPSPSATATPTATPSPSPGPTPTPRASPTPTPAATPSVKPTSNRYALLKPCPGTSNCWIYVIRSGDNLYSIAHYFGVSQARVEAMNPWIQSGLTVGRQLRIPTPTR